MKKLLLILYAAAACSLLCGCRGQMYSGHRDMEYLRPVQTIGLDRDGEAVTLSISSGIGPDGAPPLVMKATASGIETASGRLQDWSPEDELFYAHVRYILLGEDMFGGVDTVLDWVERSPAMRMDTPLLFVKGRADDAVVGALGGKTDVTERLASLERELQSQEDKIPTLLQTASSLLEQNYALCLAVELFSDEGTNFSEQENSVAIVPAGLVLLRPGSGPVWLTKNETMGRDLLSQKTVSPKVPVGDSMLELIGGKAGASGLWSGDGALTGIYIQCDLLAGVLEYGEDAEDDIALTEALVRAAEGWLQEAVSRSQELNCDFMGLEDAVLKNAPRCAEELRWDEVFPSLPLTVSVSAEISRGYDLTG